MVKVTFTRNLQRHVACPDVEVTGQTVREVLERVFEIHERVRGYVLDEQRALRQHMVVFVDGRPVDDRVGLSDAVGPDSEVCVMQALSGG